MLVLKKIIFAACVLGSSALSAGTMGLKCSPEQVSVPCLHAGWDIGGDVLYFQTNLNKNFSYYPRGEHEIYNSLSDQWNGGFHLTGSYRFNSANDVTVSWYHLNGKTAHFKFNPLGEFDPLNVHLAMQNRWDAVNGELGQFVDLTRDVKYRFYGGFQFASIKNTLDAELAILPTDIFFDLPAEESSASQLSYATEYNGFGPRTGLDLDYVLGKGFSMYVKTAAAVLVGTAKYSIQGLSANNAAGIAAWNQSLTVAHGSRTAIVPELEAKVGLTYVYPTARGNFAFDLGYMWLNYFNPLANQYIIDNIYNNQAVTSDNKTTDLGLSGLYFGVKYLANV